MRAITMTKPKPARGTRLSSRPFYTTLFLLFIFTLYSFFIHSGHGFGQNDQVEVEHVLLGKRKVKGPPDPECSQVHQVQDQCAYVRQYCMDEEAGLIPYLSFYYCSLGQVKVLGFILLICWLGLLFTTIGIAASDFFSVNLSTIAAIMGLSESLAGVTFLAFGNGSPDVFSTFAAMNSNSASMAVGELLGAASFITGVVAGSMALVREFKVDKKTYVRDICFFIVAVAFTTFFLADGHLRFWECWIMIGYYIIYVITVVTQHWLMTRRKRRQRREGEARSHIYGQLGTMSDELAGEPYRDDPEDVDNNRSRVVPDISALENGPRIEIDGQTPISILEADEDPRTEEDHERMVAADVARSMRVLRTGRARSSTITPIRPSLVGALEFRAALSQLQRESNHKLSPLQADGRSYSEAHLNRRWDQRRATESQCQTPHTISVIEGSTTSSGRSRALSSEMAPHRLASASASDLGSLSVQTPSEQRPTSPPLAYTLGGNLAPPPELTGYFGSHSPGQPPKPLHLQIPSSRSSVSAGSSPSTPFPPYADSPALLSPRSHPDQPEVLVTAPTITSGQDRPFADLAVTLEQLKPVRWWPYTVLPPPHILLATFFPTLQGWREKSVWDKIVSAISVPSIFLLVITLPVVDNDTTDGPSLDDATIMGQSVHKSVAYSACPTPADDDAELAHEDEWERYIRYRSSRSNHSIRTSRSVSPERLLEMTTDGADLPVTITPVDQTTNQTAPTSALYMKPASDIPSVSHANDETMPWNRWLVCVQIFTGPLFSVFIIWANLMGDFESPGKTLTKLVLYTLVVSLVFLGLLVVWTVEERRPKYHYCLCFLGFLISIAWISTIAGEVVGVLKAIGVILNISEALLGLTIFAAGNSVGDLVADITVARLGYPVMALAACFGGPMLNILLGIGIGGVLMMVKTANHKHNKHPDRPMKYGPYDVQVGGTLMISAITLLAILVGLLVIVPMNKWVLSRKIGWMLIAVWALSTVVNVIVEVTGTWADIDVLG